MVRKAVLAATVAAFSLAGASAQAAITTYIYSGHSLVGGGAPYSGLVGTLVTPGISFATDTGYNWHPFGLGDFGSDSFGQVAVGSAGDYTFHLSSDDGAQVFIDGILVIDRGGPHGPSVTDGTIHLTAGVHNLEVQFFECCGGPSGLDFTLATGSSFVPEPAQWALMIAGFGMIGLQMRATSRRRRTA